MKTIKTLSLVALVALGLLAPAYAAKSPVAVEVPVNQFGQEAWADNVGWLHKRNSSTAEMLVCSGRCLLKAVILNTGPLTTKLTLRNTSVENGTGAIVLIHRFAPGNTTPGNNPIPAPILLDKGITMTLSAASTEEEVEVLYRDMD